MTRPQDDLRALSAYSAAIGQDPEQVQAGGGNTSVKADGVLWVKGSGLWLKDAETRDVFVPVDLAAARRAIDDGGDDAVRAATIDAINPSGLRPSIETSLHAFLPQRFVVHTHSVRTIAHAIRADAVDLLTRKLDGQAWIWVPYVQPGVVLTRALRDTLKGRRADIVILGNHGLLVAGETLAEVEAQMAEVEQRLDVPTLGGEAPEPGAAPAGLRPVRHPRAHRLAFDPLLRGRAAAGSYYPDHVIFLGPGARADDKATAPNGVQKLTLVSDAGAFLPEDAVPSADEMALCLALVLERVPETAELVPLGTDAEATLLNWEAEAYRQALAGSAAQ